MEIIQSLLLPIRVVMYRISDKNLISIKSTVAVSLLMALMLPGFSLAQQAAPRPNFIIFIGDDIGWDDLGAYGHPHIRTPNIDGLAREGIQFNNAFLTTSQCSPTRASVLTGRYPHNTGAKNLHDPLPREQITIAEILQEAGYYTASVGKWHLGDPTRSEFDVVEEKPAIKHGLDVIKNRPKDRPFFLWFASWDAHWPYQEGILSEPHQPEDVVVPPFIPKTPGVVKDFTMYYNEIARFDIHIGQMVAALKRQGILDNTVIIIMSDNGRPFPRSKSFLYDSGIKMPFIIRYPQRIADHSVSNALISALDIAPTVIDLAGAKTPGTFQGKSLIPLFSDPDHTHHQKIYAEHNWHAFQAHERAVRTKKYLYIRNAFPSLPGMISRDYLWHSEGFNEIVALHEKGELSPEFGIYFTP